MLHFPQSFIRGNCEATVKVNYTVDQSMAVYTYLM